MRIRTLALLALCTSSSSCVVVDPGPTGPLSGDITMRWTFAGGTCSHAGVDSVQIQIAGQTLPNDGNYSCTTNGSDGIVLTHFAGGTYSFTVDGYSGQTRLYTATGSFKVDGDISVTVDLDSIVPPGGTATLTWSFPANSVSNDPTCTQAGITKVNVKIDGAAAVQYNCADGLSGGAGVLTGTISNGSHTISFSAVDDTGFEYFGGDSTVTPGTTPQHYALAWTVGGTALKWTLVDQGVIDTCAQAGVTDVFVNFRDANMQLVYTGSGVQTPCTSGAAGATFDYLAPGTYAVFLQASAPGNVMYASDLANPRTITITAGDFLDPTDASVLNITLNSN